MTKHSTTPWRAIPTTEGFRTPGANGAKDMTLVSADNICPGILWEFGEEGKANVEFVIRAVNAHQALVGACEMAETWFRGSILSAQEQVVVAALRAALEQAKQ